MHIGICRVLKKVDLLKGGERILIKESEDPSHWFGGRQRRMKSVRRWRLAVYRSIQERGHMIKKASGLPMFSFLFIPTFHTSILSTCTHSPCYHISVKWFVSIRGAKSFARFRSKADRCRSSSFIIFYTPLHKAWPFDFSGTFSIFLEKEIWSNCFIICRKKFQE